MKRQELMDFLQGDAHVSDSPRLKLLDRLCDLYATEGLLPDGADAPLFEVCRHRERCWPSGTQTPTVPSGVSVPWIGSNYSASRICVVAINLDGWGGLDAHWKICRSHIESQEQGGLGKDERWFAYRAMAYVSVVHDALRGQVSSDWEEPGRRRLAELWHECAFLESVKCSPPGSRGNPLPAMFQECPRFLLRQEIEILKPAVVLLLGRTKNRDAVRPILDPRWGTHPGSIERDTFALQGGGQVELFSLNHPSAQNPDAWRKSLQQLHESIERCPLRK